MPQHPFERLSSQGQVSLAWFWFIATVLVGVGMGLLDLPLRNELCPNGIVSLELAFTDDLARAMVGSWDARTQLVAGMGIGFDYLFLVCYSSAVGAVALNLSRGWQRGEQLARPIAWAMWAAGLFDGIENAAMAQILLGDPGTHWAPLAGGFAAIKFVLLAVGLVYLVVAAVKRYALG